MVGTEGRSRLATDVPAPVMTIMVKLLGVEKKNGDNTHYTNI